MRHAIRRTLRGLTLAAVIAAAGLPAAAKPFDQLVPEHTTVFVSARNVPEYFRQIEASPLGEAWKSPEMEAFVKKLADAFQSLFAEAGKELGYSLSDYKDLLQGEAAFVFGDPATTDFQAGRMEIPLAILVDVGAKKDKAQEFLRKNLELIDGKGKTRRSEAEFRGQKIVLLEAKEPGEKDLKALAIVLADDLLAVSLSQPFLQGILANRAEAAVKPLAEHADYKKLREKYGKDAASFLYVHVGRWLDQVPRLMKAGMGEGAAPQIEMVGKVLDLLGVSMIRAVCASMKLEDDGVSQTVFVQAPGTPKGFLKMLWTQPQALRFPALIPEDVNSCSVMQVDFGALWTMIEEGVRMAGQAMAGPAGPDGPQDPLAMFEQQVGVNFKQDLVATLGRQVIFYDRLQKPYTVQSQQMAVLVEIKDKEKFQATLDKLLAMAPFFQKKEYLGRVIYTMSMGMPAGDEGEEGKEGGKEGAPAAGPPLPALCVTDTHFVITLSKGMAEEAIRRVGKELKSVNDTPGFQAVSGRLPASALVISYQSPEIVEYWFALAKKFAEGGIPGLLLPGAAAGAGAGEEGKEEGAEEGNGHLKDFQQAFRKLPEAAVFTKHVAGMIGYGFAEEQGIGVTSHFLYKKTTRSGK